MAGRALRTMSQDMPLSARLASGVYAVVIEAVVWSALVPVAIAKMALGRSSARELRDRMGITAERPQRDRGQPRILVHAVSAGEMNAARPLVSGLAARGCRVVLTTGTRAGLEAAAKLAAEQPCVERSVYLPWDRRAIRPWLRSIAPDAVIVIETEIWPNLFAVCRSLRVPLFIANGRIRVRDVRRYRIARGFFRHVLACAEWIGVQSPRERDAFIAIGAPPERVTVAGNLKFDAAV